MSKFPKPRESPNYLPAVNPATSAADESSFSSARRLKTWLLSRMGDLEVLNGHKRRIESVSIATQEFVSCNKNRKRSFGTSGTFEKKQPQDVYLTYWLYWIV